MIQCVGCRAGGPRLLRPGLLQPGDQERAGAQGAEARDGHLHPVPRHADLRLQRGLLPRGGGQGRAASCAGSRTASPRCEAAEDEEGRPVLRVTVPDPVLGQRLALDADLVVLSAAVGPLGGQPGAGTGCSRCRRTRTASSRKRTSSCGRWTSPRTACSSAARPTTPSTSPRRSARPTARPAGR